MGWSWGTTLMATYTTQHNDKVERLVLYAPVWIRTTASLVQAGTGPIAAYRTGHARPGARRAGMTGVPEDKKADAHSGRLVRSVGGRHLGDRSGQRQDPIRRNCARPTA